MLLFTHGQSPSHGHLLIGYAGAANIKKMVKGSHAPVFGAVREAHRTGKGAPQLMAQPIREGARFRQASLDGIERVLTVLQGGDDPGEPVVAQVLSQPTNVPTREETASSNAFTWVVVLLVVGTIVPMATWWVFSR